MGLLALLSLGLAIAGPPSVLPGSAALQFTLPALNEETAMELVNKPSVALSDFAGLDPSYPHKATVLFFCSRAAGGDDLDALEQVARRYRGKSVQVVAILADTGALGPISDWVNGLQLTYPVLRDHHRVVSGRYGVSELPITYVIDASGDVFAAGNPKGGELEADLTAALDALLEGVVAP